MKDDYQQPEGAIGLEDQAFLKELGISGMPSGLEKMLRLHRSAMAAKVDIEERASGYLSLEVEEQHLAELSRETGRAVEDLRENMRLFRDLNEDPTS